MKLFTAGPVMMYDHTLDTKSAQIPYFRTDEFSEMTKQSEELLIRMVKAPRYSKAIFLTASGTGAMDATISNLFDKESKVLIISGGTFGQRFEEICDFYSIPHDTLKLGFLQGLKPDDLKCFENNDYDALLVNIHETSTGQLYDIKLLSNFCRAKGMMLIVDAISSFLADEINMEVNKIDLLILSTQKGLALSPGVSMIVISPEIIERIKKSSSKSYYFDLKKYLVDSERGQTPFTPAVGIMIEINDMLKTIDRRGVSTYVKKTEELAKHFRKELKTVDCSIPEYKLSNAITPVVVEYGAYKIFETLKNEYELFVNPGSGIYRDKIIRVGHMGNITIQDIDLLIDTILKVVP